jgi:hypothetical protein
MATAQWLFFVQKQPWWAAIPQKSWRKIKPELSIMPLELLTKYYLASVQAALGDKDKAFESLELAYKEKDGDLIYLKTDPKFDILRSDPRFEMILKKIGLEK